MTDVGSCVAWKIGINVAYKWECGELIHETKKFSSLKPNPPSQASIIVIGLLFLDDSGLYGGGVLERMR